MPITPARVALLTLLSVCAFAANSLLCRAALHHTTIDATSFTAARLAAGALMLLATLRFRPIRTLGPRPGWISETALFVYAAGFSLAYLQLPAGIGALLLIGAVQTTMIGYGLSTGEKLRPLQILGLALAFGGFVALLRPGLAAPPLLGSLCMAAAGIGWGIYSLRGRGYRGNPTVATAWNFLGAAPLALATLVVDHARLHWDPTGFTLALLSGALTSALGYILWYTALPHLAATQAAIVQLSVPILTAAGGILFLGEPLTLRLALTAAAILTGIALVLIKRRPHSPQGT